MNKFNTDQAYWELAEKILNSSITPEEQIIFNEWYKQHQDEPIEMPSGFATDEDELKHSILNNIHKRRQRPGIKPFRIYKYVAAASLIILVFLINFYFSNYKINQPKFVQLPTGKNHKEEIRGDTNKVILLLADSSQIVLDNTENGTVSNLGGALITKVDGKLICKPGKNPETQNFLNTISTPKGGQYQVTLSDGTAIWLNAASSLVFPAAFSGRERKVKLKGEAYFEVVKNPALPFIVEVDNLNISVLGTHFNVKAYSDENISKTTLLEGAIKLNKQNSAVMLRPGQEARTDSTSGIRVFNNVDVNQAVAWKNGLFEFDDSIQDIMRQIARWYNVSVVYEGKVTDKSFGGTIARKENIYKVLQLLEMTGSIHFKIEGRIVKVMP